MLIKGGWWSKELGLTSLVKDGMKQTPFPALQTDSFRPRPREAHLFDDDSNEMLEETLLDMTGHSGGERVREAAAKD